VLVTLKSLTSCPTPGANIDDPRGLLVFRGQLDQLNDIGEDRSYVRNVISAIEHVAVIFLFDVQLRGFSGSPGPSQSTMFGSFTFSSFAPSLRSTGPISRSVPSFPRLLALVDPSTEGVSA
jgi:hypothetical protein